MNLYAHIKRNFLLFISQEKNQENLSFLIPIITPERICECGPHIFLGEHSSSPLWPPNPVLSILEYPCYPIILPLMRTDIRATLGLDAVTLIQLPAPNHSLLSPSPIITCHPNHPFHF